MDAVHGVVLRECDPLGVAHYAECFGEYDRYARTVCPYLEGGADEHKLPAYLPQVRAVGMGLSQADEPGDALIARRLLALKA